ncbi:alpha/beta fold hydrolase [Streptomyces europaeiscabiei]|uniref:alpha/beta fold hydrolase n=1 Tax=Streptomyces europaeiscabiei TaxID=146819 RepID=UPI0038F713EF
MAPAAQRHPGATLHVVEGSGHLLPDEAPDEIVAMVERALPVRPGRRHMSHGQPTPGQKLTAKALHDETNRPAGLVRDLHPGYVLRPQDRVVLAATRQGLAELLGRQPRLRAPSSDL